MRLAVFLGLVVTVAGSLAPAAGAGKKEQPPGYAVGDPVADFEFPTIDGKMVRLSDYFGKVVFIQVFANW